MATITFEGETAEMIRHLRESPNVPGIAGLSELRDEIAKWEAHQDTPDAEPPPAVPRKRRHRRRRLVLALWFATAAALALWLWLL